MPFFPLGSGMPGWQKVSDNPAVLAIAAELGVTAGQVALAWLLASYGGTLLIPGTSSAVHLAENLAAGAVRLPESATAALGRLAPDSRRTPIPAMSNPGSGPAVPASPVRR